MNMVSSRFRRGSRSCSPVKHQKFDGESIPESDLNDFEIELTAPPSALTFPSASPTRHFEGLNDEDDEDGDDYEPPIKYAQRPVQNPNRDSFLGKIRLPPLTNPSQKSPQTPRNFSFPFHQPEAVVKQENTKRPTVEETDPSFTPTLTGDTDDQIRIDPKRNSLANWFQGTSDPVAIGIVPSPTKELLENPLALPNMEQRNKLQKKSPPNQPASVSRFSFFGSKPAPEQKSELPELEDDEFLNLDITAALFPGGPADPFSPAAFKNLLMNSEGLLLRLQTAYKIRTMALYDLKKEKASQEEELEETSTRVTHLKMQLDDMAQTTIEHEREMAALRDELATERKARKDEEEARKRSVLLIKTDNYNHNIRDPCKKTPVRRVRNSTGTIQSDSGFESEGESSASSVFSRPMGTNSPALTPNSSAAVSPEPGPTAADFMEPTTPATPTTPSMSQLRKPTSTFQRVLKGISSAEEKPVGGESASCQNCQGVKANEAWSVVDMLREENQGLKVQVDKLESEVDACLDLVRGLDM